MSKERERRKNDEAEVAPEGEVSALARGLAVLRSVAETDEPLGVRDLAAVTGIPKATVSRLAATLVANGLLRQDATSERFTLGSALLRLSNVYLRKFDLRSHVRSHLVALAEAAGGAVHLGIRDGLDVLVIDTVRAHSALILSRIDVGARMDMATSAAGRAYFCAATDDEKKELLSAMTKANRSNWQDVTSRLAAAQKEHARLGFCTSFGEWHPLINALGFTLRGPRGELFAVSCGGPAYLLTKATMLNEVGPALLQARETIEREVGADGVGVR